MEIDGNYDEMVDWIPPEPEPAQPDGDPRVVHEHKTPEGSWVDKPLPRPVFGMDGVFGGANPTHISTEPVSPMLAFDQIREKFIRGGLDSFELLNEVKRLMRAGHIELTPKEVKALVDAETKLAETVVKLSDVEGKVKGLAPAENKTLVLQVLNNTYNILADQMATARGHLDSKSSIELEIEATEVKVLPATPQEEKLARFRESRKS